MAEATGNVEKKKQRTKRKRLLGFPKMIYNQIEPLNITDYFKENHSEDDFSIVILATDMRRAALVIVKDGQVKVESVNNKKEEIKPAIKKAGAKIECTVETLLGIVSKKVDPVKAVLKRQLKVKGVKKVLSFVKLLKMVSRIKKEQAAAAAEATKEE